MQHIDFFQILKRSILRVFLAIAGVVLFALLCLAYARFVEPTWLRVKHITLSNHSTARIIHISDIHFAGDTQYLERVAQAINREKVDFVCFTGDLVEDVAFLQGALQFIAKINKPVYGVPGNHDQWVIRSFDEVRRTFRATGGDWLGNTPVLVRSNSIALLTLISHQQQTPPEYKRILLEHYPNAVERLQGDRFDVILAGHTHGGQVRIPFVHRFVLPFDLGTFDKGLFHTPCGPLYVSPGIGTFYLKLRFSCRPEITLIGI